MFCSGSFCRRGGFFFKNCTANQVSTDQSEALQSKRPALHSLKALVGTGKGVSGHHNGCHRHHARDAALQYRSLWRMTHVSSPDHSSGIKVTAPLQVPHDPFLGSFSLNPDLSILGGKKVPWFRRSQNKKTEKMSVKRTPPQKKDL